MPARCLNKAMLIGNLTRDPELRYTPSGSAVCSFGLATNRYWSTETGERKEDTQFHRIVSWNKLAEICSQLLGKGDKVYLEGRLQTRQWTGQDGVQRKTTEIVISDMILLRSQRGREDEEAVEESQEDLAEKEEGEETAKAQVSGKKKTVAAEKAEEKEKAGKSGEKKEEDEGKKKGKEGSQEETSEEVDSEEIDIPEDKTPF